jgi:hypothetical protein
MTGDEFILQFGIAVSLLRRALADLNTVPNKKYCNNYDTCENIQIFLSVIDKQIINEDKTTV